MKKLFLILTTFIIVTSIYGCKKDVEGKFDKPDGMYFAIDDAESGYNSWTVVTIKNKKITDVEWNSYHIDGGEAKCLGDSKYQCSVDGIYGMENVADKGAWYEQADKTTKWIVDNQKTKSDLSFDDGVADAITSVTMSTEDLFDLIEEALNSTAIVDGDYTKDGFYYYETSVSTKTYDYGAEGPTGNELPDLTGDFDSYTFGAFIIVQGRIVHADFNGTYVLYDFKLNDDGGFVLNGDGKKIVLCDADGKPLQSYITKDVAKENYGMRGSGGEWYVQANKVEEKLIADQSFNISIDETNAGIIDGLTSVTMRNSTKDFKEILDKLVEKAM